MFWLVIEATSIYMKHMNTFLIDSTFQSKQSPTVLEIQVSTTLNISAEEARLHVNRQVIPHLGTGLVACTPQLSITDNWATWFVPIQLSLSQLGNLGEVGVIRVDAQSGQITFSEEEKEQLIQHARRLYRIKGENQR